MTLILEIRAAADTLPAAYHRLERFPVTLGRGYHNDIILDDAHLNAEHVRIDIIDGRWMLVDLGTLNGTFMNNDTKRLTEARALSSGDRLRLGDVEIIVYSPQHAVNPPLKAIKVRPWLDGLQRPTVAWGLFLLSLMTLAGWTYLETWPEEISMAVIGTTLLAAAIFFVWSGLWAVAGRLITQKTHFRGHISFMALFILCSIAGWYASSYVAFLTSEGWFSVGFDSVLNVALLGIFVLGNLSLATKIKRRKRFWASFLFAAGLVAGQLIVSAMAAERFNAYAAYPVRLMPYLSGLPPVKTPAAFMDENRALFDSDLFTKKAATPTSGAK